MPPSTNNVLRIRTQELDARLHRGERIVVLDVRRRDRWAVKQGQIPGAVWVPLEEVPQRARDLPLDAQIIIYCG